jgi:alpha-L-arabinofuranosidase
MRADAGHPEPFTLNYVGIGNENHGEEYLAHVDLIKAAMDKRKPGMRFIVAAGAFPSGKGFDLSHAHAADRSDLIVDEHSYATPKWFIDQSTRYDSYPRRESRVMVGEYAAYPVAAPAAIVGRYTPNRWQSAVAEAAFLTGVERNADVVEMTCYAPLFANIQAQQWRHNLIEFTPNTVQPTVNYEVQQLFGEAVGTETRTVEMNDLPDVFASATANDESTIIKIVNTGSRARVITLAVEGATNDRAAVVQLNADRKARAVFVDLVPQGSPVTRHTSEVRFDNGAISLELPANSVTRVTTHAP